MSHDAFVLSTTSALSMQSLARVRVEMEELVNEAALEMGYSSIRDKQKEAILGFLSGRDVFVSLPTGSGKSLCYSILPKVFDRVRKASGSIVIVVSPLVSLMKDQVHSLETKGIKSVFVTKIRRRTQNLMIALLNSNCTKAVSRSCFSAQRLCCVTIPGGNCYRLPSTRRM